MNQTLADANAHHKTWGQTNINKSGELYSDYLLKQNL